ncbi:hypothetical protein KI387_003949, partial [Taxus chinensis]
PPIKVPVNVTYVVQEPNDEEENEDYEEPEEEISEEQEEPSESQVHFLTTEGMDDEDEYDEVVVDMN